MLSNLHVATGMPLPHADRTKTAMGIAGGDIESEKREAAC
jgi:hypothetical protein